MKKLAFIIISLFLCSFAFSSDLIVLKNNMQFEGEVVKIKKNKVKFLVGNYVYSIPAEDVYGIYFEDENNPAYRDLLILANGDELTDPEKCRAAQLDVEAYHGKGFGNFALGFFFGVFGFIGCAVSNPGPDKGAKTMMMSPNSELFNDPAYLSCYKKKAKGKAMVNSGIGWAAGFLFLLLLVSA